jgi:mono/diheme cytochrome c family protein
MRYPARVPIIVFIAVAALAPAGCGGSSPGTAPGPTPGGGTPLQPTLSSIQQQIFGQCTACHTTAGRTPEAGLSLLPGASHANLVNVASTTNPGGIRVIPGNPDNSILIRKLEGTPGTLGERMPLNGPFLSAAQIAVIRQWITNGALNN